MADMLYQRLEVNIRPGAQDSVHLESFPVADDSLVDTALEDAMAVMRDVVNLGRNLREQKRIRVRQPLPLIKVASSKELDPHLRDMLSPLVLEELNVKAIEWMEDASDLVRITVKANFKVLGRRLGRKMKPVAAAIAQLNDAQIQALQDGASFELEGETIALEHVLIVQETTGEGAVENNGNVIVELDIQISETLRLEGLARELVSKVQAARKEAGFEVEDRIILSVKTDSEALRAAIETHKQMICGEVLATQMTTLDVDHGAIDAGGEDATIALQRA
jgi:isoleucyl-tRNA synthetase